MRTLKNLPFLMIMVPTLGWANPYSVTADQVNRYVQQNAVVPSLAQMEGEIESLLANRRPRIFHARRILDGFVLEQINSFDLSVIEILTSHRDMKSPVWESSYKTEVQEDYRGVSVERFCLTPMCEKLNRSRPADLGGFSPKVPCRNALCASKAIFGDEQGVVLLWTYLRYGVNLSPYSHVYADAKGFSAEQQRAILTALSATDGFLGAGSLKNFGFFRFLRGRTLSAYVGDATIANAEGAVFDLIDRAGFNKQVYIFLHELGHRAALTEGGLDQSEEWLAAVKGPEVISQYAQTNAREDFAESFTLYRLDTAALKALSPARYAFLKKHVFKGQEFNAGDGGV